MKTKRMAYFRRLREEMRMAHAAGLPLQLAVYRRRHAHHPDRRAVPRRSTWRASCSRIGEVSCETNPNHLIPEIIEKLEGRVQRLSVGVQSFDDQLLREMGRLHKFGSGEQILEKIREAAPHFPSLNVDMIYNFPNQTEDDPAPRPAMVIKDSGAQQTTFYPLMTSPSVAKSLDRSVGKVDYGREARYYQIVLE